MELNSIEKEELKELQPKLEGYGWLKMGLKFGLFMYVFNTFLVNTSFFSEPLTWRSVLIGIPIWTIGGILYGLVMRTMKLPKE